MQARLPSQPGTQYQSIATLATELRTHVPYLIEEETKFLQGGIAQPHPVEGSLVCELKTLEEQVDCVGR